MTRFLGKCKDFLALVKLSNIPSTSRKYASVLFISGNRASDTFSLLSPYLDFDRRFVNLEKLKRDLALRGLKINPVEMKETWEFYKYIDGNRWALEHRRQEIGNRMASLLKKKELTQEEENEIIGLRTQGKVLKQDLKMIKETLWDLEDSVVIRALKLPNEIDDKTPEEPITLKVVGERFDFSAKERKSHLDIGKDLGILEYINPLQCFLCNEAALFELGVLAFCGDMLDEDMIRIAGSDFSRSVVVEGSGLDHEDPAETFILANNDDVDKNSPSRLHLVGGASHISFLAMHTKQLIHPENFPLRYFATGRQYSPFPQDSLSDGLFRICQSSVVHAFCMVKESGSEEYKIEFDNLLQKVMRIYDSLKIHYRVVMRSAPELQSWESLRVSIELWSVFNQQYVEVGFISACGDFISKRLLIAYQAKDSRDFPAIISGTILSVPRLLACLLEQNPQKLEIPTCIEPYMMRRGVD